MNINKVISALNNPTRCQILVWLEKRSNFLPALPEHTDLSGVCVGYIQEKAGLSQSTTSTYMKLLKDAELVVSKRHGQWTFYRRDENVSAATLNKLSEELQ